MRQEIPNKNPSYGIAAAAGGLLGFLGGAVLFFTGDSSWWLFAISILTGLFGAVIGCYFAAEPLEELREYCENLEPGGEDHSEDLQEKLDELYVRLGRDATRLGREAGQLGEDGLKIAQAAEILRREAQFLAEKCGVKRSEAD